MNIRYEAPTAEDHDEFRRTLGDSSILCDRAKIIVEDDNGKSAYTFMKHEDIARLGKDYINTHAKLRYSAFADDYFVEISENDYYNDPERNPEMVVHLVYDGLDRGTGREVYRDISTGRFFLREVHYPREEFAKWFVCGKRRRIDDGDEPRPNVIFEHNGQHEKVRYDDWNGVAAYSDTFNKRFNAAQTAQEGTGASAAI